MHHTARTRVHTSGRCYITAVTNVVQMSGWMTTSPADAVTTSLKEAALFPAFACNYIQYSYFKKYIIYKTQRGAHSHPVIFSVMWQKRLTPMCRVTGGRLWDGCHFSPVSRDNFCSFCCLTSACPPLMSSSRRTLDKYRAAVGDAAVYDGQDHKKIWKKYLFLCIMVYKHESCATVTAKWCMHAA